jgi:hypothetical protein
LLLRFFPQPQAIECRTSLVELALHRLEPSLKFGSSQLSDNLTLCDFVALPYGHVDKYARNRECKLYLLGGCKPSREYANFWCILSFGIGRLVGPNTLDANCIRPRARSGYTADQQGYRQPQRLMLPMFMAACSRRTFRFQTNTKLRLTQHAPPFAPKESGFLSFPGIEF